MIVARYRIFHHVVKKIIPDELQQAFVDLTHEIDSFRIIIEQRQDGLVHRENAAVGDRFVSTAFLHFVIRNFAHRSDNGFGGS